MLWKSKKQFVVAHASDMGVSLFDLTLMYCDNKNALQHGTVSLPFVSSTLQLANFFTKSHAISRFQFLLGKLSMPLAAPL